jgi:hypothetical protein
VSCALTCWAGRTRTRQCVDVYGISRSQGAKLHLWQFIDGGNQKFRVFVVSGRDKVVQFSPMHITEACFVLDIDGGSHDIGAWNEWGIFFECIMGQT